MTINNEPIQELSNKFFYIQYKKVANSNEMVLENHKLNNNKIKEYFEENGVLIEIDEFKSEGDSSRYCGTVSSFAMDGEISPELWMKFKKEFKEQNENLFLNFIEINISTYKYQINIEVHHKI